MPYTSSDQGPRGMLENDGKITEKNYRHKIYSKKTDTGLLF